MNTGLHKIITDRVFEEGISRMILDDLNDLREMRLEKNINIRQVDNNKFKIYQGEKIYRFTSRRHYCNEIMKQNDNEFVEFCKEFIGLFEKDKFEDNLYREFIFDIILEMIKECFKRNKDTLINFIDEENIHNYIKQGIFDNVEDLYYNCCINSYTREEYEDFNFGDILDFQFEEDNDMDNLDIEDYNRFREQNNNHTFIENNEWNETLRFKAYLENNKQKEFERLELNSLEGYMKSVVLYYSFDFKNFVRRTKGLEELEEIDDDIEYA